MNENKCNKNARENAIMKHTNLYPHFKRQI